jgi:outer membrane lipoprotein-sorting protein
MPNRVLVKVLFVVFVCLISARISHQEELSGRDIIERCEHLTRGHSNYGFYEIEVITPNWQRSIKIEGWEKGWNRSFIYITEPAKERGNSYLKLDYNMWQYMPKIERTIKIPPSMMKNPWMGSDLTNDDMVKETNMVDDYAHDLIGVENISGHTAYKIVLVPNPEAAIVWGKIIMYIRVDDYVPLRKEFYDERDNLERIITFSDIKWMHDRTIPTLWTVENTQKHGYKTFLRFVDIQYNIPIEDSVFSMHNLKRRR